MAVLTVLASAALAACRGPSREAEPPNAWVELRAQAGSPLDARPLETLDRSGLDEGLGVRFRAWSVPMGEAERRRFEPVGAEARLIVSLQLERTVLPTPYLAKGARIASGESAEVLLARLQDTEFSGALFLGEWQEAVPNGTTLELDLRPPGRLGSPLGSAARVGVTVSVDETGREPTGLVGVVWESSSTLPDFQVGGSAVVLTEGELEEAAPEDVDQRELVLLNRRLEPGGPPLAALFPNPEFTSRTLVILIEASSEPAGDFERTEFSRLLDFARARILESDETARLVTGVEPQGIVGWRALREALGWPDRQRESLVYLARATSARLAEDLALIASPVLLEDLATRIRGLPSEKLSAPADRLGLEIEEAAIETLRERIETPAWQPGFVSILVRRYGALGRDFASVGDLIGEAQSLSELGRSIEEENWVRLESSSPSDRTRAFDWLRRQGEAPAGYDPLADRASRRAALRAAVRQAAGLEAEPPPAEAPGSAPKKDDAVGADR